MEIWQAINGWADLYEASSLGRIRNMRSRRGTQEGKILKGRPNRDGYLKVVLQHDGRKKNMFVHRVVHEAFLGPIPLDHEIDHLNSDKTDNRASNLEAVTKLENMQRSFRKGRNSARGSSHSRSVFTEALVEQIRVRVAAGEKQNAIAAQYGVTPTAINCIVKLKTWRHVELPHSQCQVSASQVCITP